MKKNNFLWFTVITLITLLLVGCNPSTDGENTGQGGGNTPTPPAVTGNVICSPETTLNIVIGSDANSNLAYDIQESVYNYVGIFSNVCPTMPEGDPENTIYIGRVDTDLSREAYDKLDVMIEMAEQDSGYSSVYVGYTCVVEGSRVAIAFTDDMYDSTETVAVEEFISKFITGKEIVAIDNGLALNDYYDYFEFLDKNDEEYYEKAWETLLNETGNAELVESLKRLKTLYGDGVVSWLANLYDEEIGAFYYSNSGRDNQGFLPDADSTYQAIVLIGHMGMKRDFGYGVGSYPDGFVYKFGAFAKKLQDPNGFFYHPQWTKEMVDAKLTRRARDLVRSQALISMAGMKPTYNTPDGGVGDGLVWNEDTQSFVPIESLTKPLTTSVAFAVSKVVSTSTYIPDNLKSKEALESYLDRFIEKGTNFYSVNNEIANQTSQIKFRDKQLAAEGANWRAIPIIIEFLNKHQNPENGTWSNVTNYNAVDGLFKAAHVYSDLGYPIPNAMAAATTALEAITSEQATTHICNIYNCWCTLQMIIKNLTQFGAPGDATTVVNNVRAVAAPSIDATLVKYLEFRKEDHSFSYYKDRCSAESQGMQLAIQCNEGDMNATSLCHSVWGTIFDVLRLGEYEVALHATAEFAKFVHTIDGIGGVIKNPPPEPTPITFDDDNPGSINNEVTYSLVSPGSYAMVVDDPREGVKGNVLELASNPGGGDTVMVGVDKLSLGTCFIFEGEFCVVDAKKDYIMQINLGPSGYMLNLKLIDAKDENGEPYKKVQILECSSQSSPRIERDLGVSARLGEWFKIRFEYYLGSHDSVRIKVFFNDTLAAISDNYYDHRGEKIINGVGYPQKYYSYTQINVMSSQLATIHMDNLFAAKTEDRFVPAHDINNQPLINCDPPVRDEIIYDFEDLEVGKNYPEDFTVSAEEGDIGIVEYNGSKQLSIIATGQKTVQSLYLPSLLRGPKANCAVTEMTVTAKGGEVGSAINLRFRADDKIKNDTGAITAFNLEITEKNGEKYISVAEAPNGKTVSYISGADIPLGDSFKLRIEHYEDAHISLVYINDILIASSDKLTTGAGSRSFGRFEISTITQSTIEILIDNFKAEKLAKSFTEATKPGEDEKLYDFEEGLDDAVTDGKIIENNQGHALILNGNTLALPLNVRSVITSFVGFNSVTTFGGINETVHRIAFVTETGKYVLAYELISISGEVFVYEFTQHGRAALPIAHFTPVVGGVLDIKYYPQHGVCQIIYNENCVAVSSVVYSDESSSLEIGKLIISTGSNGSLTLDDCIFESYNALYVEKTPLGDNSEDGATEITFESSSTGNLPSALTYKLYSLGADIRVEQMLDKMNAATKALILDATSDVGGDEVAFAITNPSEEEWNALVFEADLKFNAENLNRISYQIFFEGKTDGNNTRQYLTSIYYSNDLLRIKDYSYAGGSIVKEIDGQEYRIYRNDGPVVSLAPTPAEWFNLRIEIYKGSRSEMKIITYVDDVPVLVTNNFYRSHDLDDPNPLEAVEQVKILALTECEASIIMDNVSVTQTAKDIPDAATYEGAVIKNYSGTNKPIIIVPEVPDDTDIPEIIDYENGRIYTNTKAEDKNGTEPPTLVIKDGKLNFISDGGDYLYIRPTVSKGSYTHSSFEADLTFSFDTTQTSGKRAFYTFTAVSDNGSTFRFNIEYDIGNGAIIFSSLNSQKTYASVPMKKVIGTAGVPTQETVTLNYRLEFFFIGGEVVILNYFDDTLVYAVNSREEQSYVTNDGVTVDYNLYYNYNPATNARPYTTFSRVEINSHSGTSTTLTLDNLRFVQDNGTLDEELVKPKPGTLIKGEAGTGVYYKADGGYEFNVTKIWNEIDLNNAAATTPFIWRSTGGTADNRYVTADGKASAGEKYGYISIASQGTNKTLEYGQLTSDERNSRIYLKSTNTTGNLYVFETDLVIGSESGLEAGDQLLSFMLGTDKNERSAFFGNLKVFKTEEGYEIGYSQDKIFAQMVGSTWYNIAVEYYHQEGIARYYLNGQRIASEKIVTAMEIGDYAFASVALAAKASDAFIRLDNTVVTAMNKEFEAIEGEVDPLATVLPVKGGKNGILVLIHDDGDLDTMSRLDRIYSENSLTADVAMVVNRVYDVNSGSVKDSAADWQSYLDKGWGVINHSLTHTFWGNATEEEITIDEEKLMEEIVNSADYLRAAFPSERVLTFAYPGFSSIVDTLGYGKVKTYMAARRLIESNYISAREYNFKGSSPYTVRFFDADYSFLPASSISLGDANLTRVLERIDGAASGGITVLFSHKVCADGEEKSTDTSTVPESYIEAIAEKAGEYVNEGLLWSGNYEDVMLYIREASAAKVTTKSDSDKITVTLTDTLDDEIYNYALTVEVIVPDAWAGVKVVQGDKVSYARAFERGGKHIVYVDVVPDGGDAVLTPESENLPAAPVLPCDHTDPDGDGYCNVCTREYHDQNTCVHKDDDSNGVCDKCEIGYYDPATCPHVDRDVNRVCDNCGTTYYDPATCEHTDENLDALCDNCGTTYYTEETCPGHTDNDGNTVCDTCGCVYADPLTCRHKDADGNSLCDKCGITYHDPATCEHTDENQDEVCDKCKKQLGKTTELGGNGSDDQGWLGED